MRCQNCGFTNSPSARFCKQCGTSLSHATAAPATPATAAAIPARDAAQCPQCATPSVAGKRFCRQCRFDYAAPAAVPTATTVTHDPVAATPAGNETAPMNHPSPVPELATVETAPPAESDVASAPASRSEPAAAAESDGDADQAALMQACPQCSTARVSGKRFCHACGFDYTTMAAAEAPKTSASVGEAHARTEDLPLKTSGKKALLIGGAAVIVVGIALGAGLFIRAQHAKTSNEQTAAASAPLATSTQPDLAPASTTTVNTAASDAAAETAPASSPSDALAASASDKATASSASVAAAAHAQPSPVPGVATQTAQSSAPAQNPAVPAQVSASEPQTQSATSAASPGTPSVHPKQQRSITPPTDNSAGNATIRSAIAGSLADGNSCFGNKKFDCAISDADAVLRLDPHNAQALALRKRAKAAQESALNNLSIQ